MNKTSTLLFLYDNRDSEEVFAIGKDEFFNEMFEDFSDVINLLEIKQFEPKLETIEKVLAYAKKI